MLFISNVIKLIYTSREVGDGKKYMVVRRRVPLKSGPRGLEFGNLYFERGNQFKVLGTIITNYQYSNIVSN